MLPYISLLLFGLFSTTGYGFPEMVRYGYTSCVSCHVSPGGGGITTEYGKRLSEEVLSTWAKSNESNFAHNAIPLPSWLLTGGDIRELWYTTQYGSAINTSRTFLMQADGELGVATPIGVTAVGSWGRYNERNYESRRHYIKYVPTESISLRAGKFLAAYGIMTPEHDISTRKGIGFNQGTESYNAELGLFSKYGEMLATKITKWDDRKNLHEDGWSLRVAAYAPARSVIGWSYYYGTSSFDPTKTHMITGPFCILGFTEHFYLMADLSLQKIYTDWHEFYYRFPGLFTYEKLGYEFYKGMHVSFSFDYQVDQIGFSDTAYTAIGPGFSFYPRPHFEISGSWMKQNFSGIHASAWGDIANVVLHYYF
jgi:hypothetical protein